MRQSGVGVTNLEHSFAQQVRQKRRSATDKWHLDEVFVTINGQRYYLWQAVDSDGMVLNIFVQPRRRVVERTFA